MGSVRAWGTFCAWASGAGGVEEEGREAGGLVEKTGLRVTASEGRQAVRRWRKQPSESSLGVDGPCFGVRGSLTSGRDRLLGASSAVPAKASQSRHARGGDLDKSCTLLTAALSSPARDRFLSWLFPKKCVH